MSATTDEKRIKPIPNRGNHFCFGCSPQNPYGLKMTFFTDEESVFSRLTVPAHLGGWDRLVHGGVIATILDETMSWSAIYFLRKVILTRTMTIDFIKPVFIGEPLRSEGRVRERTSERNAVMEALLFNPAGELCARSTAVLALFSQKASKRLGILNEETLRDFAPLIDPD